MSSNAPLAGRDRRPYFLPATTYLGETSRDGELVVGLAVLALMFVGSTAGDLSASSAECDTVGGSDKMSLLLFGMSTK